jgi:hypothetical protein
LTRAVESASAIVTPQLLVTRSKPTLDLDAFSQSLDGAYFGGSEGEEGVLDHQVHFSVAQLETGDTPAYKWEPELHELPSKASKLNFCTKSKSDASSYPPSA